MIKKAFVLFFLLITMFSCVKKESAILVDAYFDELYKISDEKIKDSDMIVLDPINIDYLDLSNYDSVITTSLLYRNKYQLFKEYKNELFVIDYYGELKNDSHFRVNTSYIELYNELFDSVLKDVDLNNIAFIITEGMNIDTREHNTLMITKKTIKRDISTFINNSDQEYWIVLNASYLYYINEVLEDKKRILLDSAELMLFDNNVLASVDQMLKTMVLKRSSIEAKIKKR